MSTAKEGCYNIVNPERMNKYVENGQNIYKNRILTHNQEQLALENHL
jgi:hypothetical protein